MLGANQQALLSPPNSSRVRFYEGGDTAIRHERQTGTPHATTNPERVVEGQKCRAVFHRKHRPELSEARPLNLLLRSVDTGSSGVALADARGRGGSDQRRYLKRDYFACAAKKVSARCCASCVAFSAETKECPRKARGMSHGWLE